MEIRKDELRINRRIRVSKVRLIDETGKQIGVFITSKAVELAEQRGLDLVEVSPNTDPPVCKIMDYGKFKYEKSKKDRKKRKDRRKGTVKEIKFRPKTEAHDYIFKIKNIRKFLEAGHKVKITMMFRGRELTHKELGEEKLIKVFEELRDEVVVEREIQMEGRNLFMIVAPSK